MVLADQRTCPPSLCSFITLITYQFSFLLCACLACLRVSLCVPTLAPRTLLAYQQKIKGCGKPLVLVNKRTCPPSLFAVWLHNLNHVSVFLLLFACFACLRASLCSPTLTLAPRTRSVGVGLSTYVIKSFWTSFRSFYPPTNRFRFCFFSPKFLLMPPYIVLLAFVYVG